MRARQDKQINTAVALAQLRTLLANATDERLCGFTADQLARMYRIAADHRENARQIECLLLAAQDRRRRSA